MEDQQEVLKTQQLFSGEEPILHLVAFSCWPAFVPQVNPSWHYLQFGICYCHKVSVIISEGILQSDSEEFTTNNIIRQDFLRLIRQIYLLF